MGGKGNTVATRKKKPEKNIAVLLSTKELKNILSEEMSPSGKLLRIGIILSGGIEVNPYTVGYALKMHPAEVHHGFSELKHKKIISPGNHRDTVTITRR